ncbi:MAG: mannose-1-phosphate guanylyltransferase/mannose-6-phosphate isomerase [bacterium]|nr:mannose-1-phosphate guanylyltransferase/mannose-6-phosphate isomerase [bacterium]MDT8396665.1 mannose-1-phosphate guanylyltransferase/mannose-6-phosphate isomerase [bacterium]
MNALYALVLAGGSGVRLWPVSRQLAPKQFINLMGELTLFQQTVKRMETRVSADRMVFVTSREHEGAIRDQLRGYLGSGRAEKVVVVGEPAGRNTAPAVLLGARIVSRQNPDAVMLVAPSDHVILDSCAFADAVDESMSAAARGMIVTFGIKPTRPETGYGYIRIGDQAGKVFKVDRFEEKPDAARAEVLSSDRRYLWNSGIFLFSVRTIMEEARKHLPELMDALDGIDPGDLAGLDECYGKLQAVSLDHGIMEKTDRAAVKPVSMGWSDLGSWDSYYEMNDKDMFGNVVTGDAVSLDNEGCLVAAGSRLLGVVGMKDTIIVQTEDATLLCPRGRSQEVRRVVEHLAGTGRAESMIHPTVVRPWGEYTVLIDQGRYKVKRLTVAPGQKMSLQKHERRSEHWVMVSGEVAVVRGDENLLLKPNEGVTIPVGMLHRIENPGPEPAELVEVQLGEYVGEDDIVRYDDDYGRVKESPKPKVQRGNLRPWNGEPEAR